MASVNSIHVAKAALRTELKHKLRSMCSEERITQSQIVTNLVIKSPEFQKSQRISIYLSMPEEVSTMDLLAHIFHTGRQCFVPSYTKDNMRMLQLFSMEDYESLPLTKWNIRQPEPDHLQRAEPLLSEEGLDLVILPGLGFSYNPNTDDWMRLGRGKGYYDTYLERCQKHITAPITVALAFKEQIEESLPTAEHDRNVNRVFHA